MNESREMIERQKLEREIQEAKSKLVSFIETNAVLHSHQEMREEVEEIEIRKELQEAKSKFDSFMKANVLIFARQNMERDIQKAKNKRKLNEPLYSCRDMERDIERAENYYKNAENDYKDFEKEENRRGNFPRDEYYFFQPMEAHPYDFLADPEGVLKTRIDKWAKNMKNTIKTYIQERDEHYNQLNGFMRSKIRLGNEIKMIEGLKKQILRNTGIKIDIPCEAKSSSAEFCQSIKKYFEPYSGFFKHIVCLNIIFYFISERKVQGYKDLDTLIYPISNVLKQTKVIIDDQYIHEIYAKKIYGTEKNHIEIYIQDKAK